jgi:C_GCAxxG_C_C family probable redox protein
MDIVIGDRVHELYWKQDINCARTMLICLCELFDKRLEKQTMDAAIGLHGAGGFRSQCGLVEGALMFLGICFAEKGKTDSDIAGLCYQFAEEFTNRFGSLSCYDLRPNGFCENDPPHACEKLTCAAIEFAKGFMERAILS